MVFGRKRVRASGTNVEYYQDAVIGQENRDYSLSDEKRTEYQKKVSGVLDDINNITTNGNIWEKIEQLGNICDWYETTEKVLSKIAVHIDKKNMAEAEKIFAREFIPIRHCEIKGALSPGEIKNVLNNKNAFMKFYEAFTASAEQVKKLCDQFRMINKIRLRYLRAKTLIAAAGGQRPSPNAEYREELSEAAQARQDLMTGKKQMEELIDTCTGVLELAPAGMSQYIKLSLDAFKASDVAVELIDRYAARIEDSLKEIDKLFDAAEENPNSSINLRRKAMNEKFQDDIISDSNKTKDILGYH